MTRSEELTNDFLMHYGVKGMRWGVRKDARKDTSIGKKKNKNKENKSPFELAKDILNNSESITRDAGDIVRKKNSRKKVEGSEKISTMSDQELQRALNRHNLEKAYRNMLYEDSKASARKERIASYIDTIGKVMSIAGSAAAIAVGIAELRKNGSEK